MTMEIPSEARGVVATTLNRALSLTREPSARGSYDALIGSILEWGIDDPDVLAATLSSDDRAAVNQLKRPRSQEEKLMLWRAQQAVGPITERTFRRQDSGWRRVDVQPIWERVEGTDEERAKKVALWLTAAIESGMDADETNMDRYAMQERTVSTSKTYLDNQVNDILRMLGLTEISRLDRKTWLTPREIRARLCDAGMAGAIDPTKFPQSIIPMLAMHERTRIFVPDILRLYPGAKEALGNTFRPLKTATDVGDDEAAAAIRGEMTGQQMRSVASAHWDPILLHAARFEQVGGLWVPKDVEEKPARFGTKDALDYLSGNDPEFKEKSPGVYYLTSETDITTDAGEVLVVMGSEFTLFDPIFDMHPEVRERLLSRQIQSQPVYKEGAVDPLRPERVVPGELLYTLPEIFREMDGQGPLRNYYLRRAGIDPKRFIGHRTTSGFALETTSVLSWDDDFLLLVNPDERGELTSTDLACIKAAEFYNNALLMFGIQQWDQMFDWACQSKQTLETSMRALAFTEYQNRHSIGDTNTRDLTLSMFSALTGRKLGLNPYVFSMYQSYELARKGVVVDPRLHNIKQLQEWALESATNMEEYLGLVTKVGLKRIDDITDPFQLEGVQNYLGLIRFHPVVNGSAVDVERLEDQRRILEHYEISRREYPGQDHDLHEASKLFYQARYIGKLVKDGTISRAEGERRLLELRDEMLTRNSADYLDPEITGQGEDTGFYWDKRSPFEHPRPAIEQAAMLAAMGAGEGEIIRDVSHKGLIISMGGPSDLPDWAYEGWYGKLMSLKYANSMADFMYGEDTKMEQMQLKYMGVRGRNVKAAVAAQTALVQAITQGLGAKAGVDVGKWNPDEIGEVWGREFAIGILNSPIVGITEASTLRDYFKALRDNTLGYAGSLNHLPGPIQKRVNLMWSRAIHRIIETGFNTHYKIKSGIGSSGSDLSMLRLDFENADYGWVDQMVARVFRERGDEVCFPDRGNPYVTVKGHKTAYALEGVIDPETGEWIYNDTELRPLRERYMQRKLEMFSTNVAYRIIEEFMRDSTVFDVNDREWIMEDIKREKALRYSRYLEVTERMKREGFIVMDPKTQQWIVVD